MFKYLILICFLLFDISLSVDEEKEVTVNQESQKNVFKPNGDGPEIGGLPQLDPNKPEMDNSSCNSVAKIVYDRCQIQYYEITKGEQNVKKICCAVKTLQQCLLPAVNENCNFEAINYIERELHGVNQICQMIGSRSCPRKDKN